MKQRWVFIGRDKFGWLGFRCVDGPNSIHSYSWRGDYFVAPDAFWVGQQPKAVQG